MRRILLVLPVAAVMAAMLVASAGPAFSQVPCDQETEGNPSGDQPGGVETCEDTQNRLFDFDEVRGVDDPNNKVAFHNTETENPGGTTSITSQGGDYIAQSPEAVLLGSQTKHCPPDAPDAECVGNFDNYLK